MDAPANTPDDVVAEEKEKAVHAPGSQHTGPILILVLFNVVFFLPLFQGDTYSIVAAHSTVQYPWRSTSVRQEGVYGLFSTQGDQAETFYPLSVFGTNALRSGQFPLWLPYSFAGVPVVELGLTGFLYPPRLLAMLLLSPIQQHDWLLFIHLMMAGLSMYGLLRSWGATGAGAVVGAMAWQLNGHNSFWLVVEHVAIVAAWLPLSLLCATLAVRRLSLRWSIATGTAMAMTLLAGSPQYAYLNGVILAVCYAILAIHSARGFKISGDVKSMKRALMLPLTSFLVAVGLSAVYWLPFIGWLSGVHRPELHIDGQVAQGLHFSWIVESLVEPNEFFGTTRRGAHFGGFAFLGFPAALVALLSVLRRNVVVLLSWSVCLLALLAATGWKPLLLIVRTVLPYSGTMFPHVALYVFVFAAAILAGLGASELVRLLSKWRIGNVAAVVLLALIAVQAWQLISVARRVNPKHPSEERFLLPETPMLTRLKEEQGDTRFVPISRALKSGDWSPPVLAGKSAAVFELKSATGYESLLPRHVAKLWRMVEARGQLDTELPHAYRPAFTDRDLPLPLLRKTSVALIAAPPEVNEIVVRSVSQDGASSATRLSRIYQGPDGTLFRDPGATPRAFVVNSVTRVEYEDEALRLMADPAFDIRKSLILVRSDLPAGYMEDSEAGLSSEEDLMIARIVDDRLNQVRVEVSSSRPGWLVLNDSWAPGWRAYIDGNQERVLKANYAFRAVPIPVGIHTVTFLYRPTNLFVGLGISICSIIVCVGLAVQRRKKPLA